jgi:hypothetical protein
MPHGPDCPTCTLDPPTGARRGKRGRAHRPQRVLDSTPLYDAVATKDALTFIRSAIRGLHKVAVAELVAELRAALRSGDDYASWAKRWVDWVFERLKRLTVYFPAELRFCRERITHRIAATLDFPT